MEYFNNNFKLFKEIFNIDLPLPKEDEETIFAQLSKHSETITFHENSRESIVHFSSMNNEADELLNRLDFSANKFFFVIIGFGTGSFLRNFLKRVGSNFVLILENSPLLLSHVAKNFVLEDILSCPNINIALYNSRDDLDKILSEYLSLTLSVNSINGVITPGYELLFPDTVNLAMEELVKFHRNASFGLGSLNVHLKKILESLFNNLCFMIDSPSLDMLQSCFPNSTAIVVSAGPSLEKNAPQLKGSIENCIIITGARNVRYLIDNDIIPDFVCILDPQDIIDSFVYDFCEDPRLNDTIFICCEHSNHTGLARIKQRKMFCTVFIHDILKSITNISYPTLPQGGSVAHLCTSAAAYLGCKTIIFMGQDFAYTNNQFHAEGVSYKSTGDNIVIKENKKYFYVEGVNEEKVLTDETLNNYRVWLEEYISSNPNISFINCTEGGARIHGARDQLLKETIKHNSTPSTPVYDVNKAFSTFKPLSSKKISNRLSKMKDDCILISSKYEKMIRLLQNMLAFFNGDSKINIQSLLKEYDNLAKFINTRVDLKTLINMICVESFRKIDNSAEYTVTEKDSDLAGNIKFCNRNIKICEITLNALKLILEIIAQPLQKLK